MAVHNFSLRDASKNALISIFDTKDEAWSLYGETQEFLDFINPIEKDVYLNKRNIDIFIRALPFYQDTKLIKVQSKAPDDEDFVEIFYLQNENDLIHLNGNSEDIHEINESGDLSITDDNVFDYLKFFAAFVSDDETQQSFFVIENELSELLRELSPHRKNRALRRFEGSTVETLEEEQGYLIKTRMIYCDSIFDANFKLTPDGMVVMQEDKLVGSL